MPEIKYFKVNQTRSVRVTANNIVDAIRLATAAFENGQNSDYAVVLGPDGVWGNTNTKVEVTDISAYKE